MNHKQTGLGLLALFMAALSVLLIWVTLPAAPAGFDWDDTWYLWMAEWYSGRSEFRDVAWVMMQARQYPPLFPYLLSHTGDVLISHAAGLVMNALFLAAAATVTLKWLLTRGLPLVAAVAGATMMVVNPVALTFMPTLMSEPLYLLLTTAVLVLAGSDSKHWRVWLSAGLLVGLAVATRSAGWALVAALMTGLLVGGRLGHLKLLLPGLVLGLLINAGLKSGLPDAHQYVEGFAENLGNIGVAYVLDQGTALATGWAALWGSGPAGLVTALLVLPGWLVGLKKGRVEAWYVLISIAMLLAWPFPGQMDRFLWVLMPAALALMPLTLALWSEPRVVRNAAIAALVLVLLMSVPAGLWRTAERLTHPPGEGLDHLSRLADWTRPPDRETALINVQVRSQLLEDAVRIERLSGNMQCVYSELPALVSIRGKRIAFASPWNTLDEYARDRRKCRFYYLVPGALPGADAPAVQRFSREHEELFRSAAPWDVSGNSALGIFYRLQDAE